MAQMRSPSPEANPKDFTDSSMEDLGSRPQLTASVRQPVTALGPPGRQDLQQGRAGSHRAGQSLRQGRAEPIIDLTNRHSPSSLAVDPNPDAKDPKTPAAPQHGLQLPVAAAREAASASTQSTASDIVPVKQGNNRCDATQQTAPIAADSTPVSPVKMPEVSTDERSTQTPIAYASPRPLWHAPPGRDSQWPVAGQSPVFDGQPPGHERHSSAPQRADPLPSGVPFEAASRAHPFAAAKPVSLRLHSQGQMQRQQPVLAQGRFASQGQVTGQLPQQLPVQLPDSAQLLTQLSGQDSVGNQQPVWSAGHPAVLSDILRGVTLSDSAQPLYSRAADALPAPDVTQVLDPLGTRTVDSTGVSGNLGSGLPHAQQHDDGAAPTRSASGSASHTQQQADGVASARGGSHSASHAASGVQQPHLVSSDAQASAPYLAVPSLPFQGPHIAGAESDRNGASHSGNGDASRGYYQSYSKPAYIPSGQTVGGGDDSWLAAAEQEEGWLSGAGGPALLMPRRPTLSDLQQMPHQRRDGKRALV